jgi:HAD superfamily hydrolase (TIGR01509 family)
MQYEAIIFDCDGTLVDSERLVNEVVVEFAASFGIRLSVDEALARFKGAKMADCMLQLESLGGKLLPSSFVTDLRARMAVALSARLKPVDGALDLVRSLTIPFCVASSGPRDKIELSLSVTGLLPYFEGRIFSSYEIGSWKPDPGLFMHAARSLGAHPQRCAVVEDSIPGIEAGIAAGMTVFALIDESVSVEIPASVHAISRLQELVTRFAS